MNANEPPKFIHVCIFCKVTRLGGNESVNAFFFTKINFYLFLFYFDYFSCKNVFITGTFNIFLIINYTNPSVVLFVFFTFVLITFATFLFTFATLTIVTFFTFATLIIVTTLTFTFVASITVAFATLIITTHSMFYFPWFRSSRARPTMSGIACFT